jgi:hypothetical protein
MLLYSVPSLLLVSFVSSRLLSATSLKDLRPQKNTSGNCIYSREEYTSALLKLLKFNTSLWRKEPEHKVCEENI